MKKLNSYIKWDHNKKSIIEAANMTSSNVQEIWDKSSEEDNNKKKIEILTFASMNNLIENKRDLYELIHVMMNIYDKENMEKLTKNSEVIEYLAHILNKDEALAFYFFEKLMKIEKIEDEENKEEENTNKF